MEKNSSMDDLSDFDRALSLPHFDEDATLVSARPVVPLQEIYAKARSRRGVILGLMILAAIIVGGIGGTLLLRSGQTSQSPIETGVSKPTASASGVAGGPTSNPVESKVSVSREPDEEPRTREVSSNRDSLTKKRIPAAISRNSVKPARVASPEAERREDLENDEREIRRAERRNARQEARRELRRRREQRDDELLRIREIFEGPSRP
jgi:hypothetical protein